MKTIYSSVNVTQKKLTITEPVITLYTQHAHMLSILSSYEKAYPWILSNYIQIYINRDYQHRWGDFYFPFPYELRPADSCQWINTQKFHRDWINTIWDSIIDFIIDNISKDNYIHMMVNCFHLPPHERYQKLNLMHDCLIYGFDREQEILYVSDFYNQGKYSHAEILFEDFIHAFNAYEHAENHDYLNKMVYLYKFNHNCNYLFDINNIMNSVYSYNECIIPEYWKMYNHQNIEDIVFGRKIYTTLKNYLMNNIHSTDFKIDLRPFSLLYEHKKMMALRINFLAEQGYLRNMEETGSVLKKIENDTKALIYLLIKYQLSARIKIIDEIVYKLEEIEPLEYKVLKNVLSQ